MSHDRPDQSYPRHVRLRRRDDFARLLAEGDVFPGRQALVRRRQNEQGEARLGISTPRSYGKSVRRNVFRRRVREAFRTSRHALGAYDYLVSPRKHLQEPTVEGIRGDLLRTLTVRPVPPRAGGRKAGKR